MDKDKRNMQMKSVLTYKYHIFLLHVADEHIELQSSFATKNTILKDNFPVSETKGKTDFISNYINIGNQNQSENKQKNL